MIMNKQKRESLKIAILSITALLLVALLITLYLVFFRVTLKFTDKDPILEKGFEYPALDYVLKSNGEVMPADTMLDTSAIGEHEFIYTVKRPYREKQFTFKYTVADTIPPTIEIIEKEMMLRINQDFLMDDLKENIIVDEGEITFKGDINIDAIGDYPITVIVTDEGGNTSSDDFMVLVREDSQPPLLLNSGNGAEIRLGSEFDIDDIIGYGDDLDSAPSLELTGYVDTNTLGSYPLHARISDRAGNSFEWDFTVSVVEQPDYYQNNNPRISFEDFMNTYAGPGRHFGIDVSEWQGDIDFEAVRDAGCEFVFIRFGYSFKGEMHADSSFETYLKQAKTAGIPVGIYLYSYDNNDHDVRLAVSQIKDVLGDTKLELPIVFDWENFSNFQEYGISFEELNRLYDVFAKECEAYGYKAMLYGSKLRLEEVWKHTEQREIWLANYVDWSSYKGSYRYWQATNIGRIDGIDGDCDFNIMFEQE